MTPKEQYGDSFPAPWRVCNEDGREGSPFPPLLIVDANNQPICRVTFTRSSEARNQIIQLILAAVNSQVSVG